MILNSGPHHFPYSSSLPCRLYDILLILFNLRFLYHCIFWHVLITHWVSHLSFWPFHLILLPDFLFLCLHIKYNFIPFALIFSSLEFIILFNFIDSNLIWYVRFQIIYSTHISFLGFILFISIPISYRYLNIIISKWITLLSNINTKHKIVSLPMFLYFQQTIAPHQKSGSLLQLTLLVSGIHLMFSSTLATYLKHHHLLIRSERHQCPSSNRYNFWSHLSIFSHTVKYLTLQPFQGLVFL